MFGQLVLGAPGSGKTTYCHGLQLFLELVGRDTALINLDPANEDMPYRSEVDIGDLVSLDGVQEQLDLGPNGGLLYCMAYLAANLDWLDDKLAPLKARGAYLVIDCPGQVELFTTNNDFSKVVEHLTRKLDVRLAAVNLVDGTHCLDPAKYIGGLLSSLATMLHLELPHINVLSKVDLAKQQQRAEGDEARFPLQYYLEAANLDQLVDSMQGRAFSAKYRQLSEGLVDVVEGFSLVAFVPLAIEDRKMMSNLQRRIDLANGYTFATAVDPYALEGDSEEVDQELVDS